jgi:hypothetical protein
VRHGARWKSCAPSRSNPQTLHLSSEPPLGRLDGVIDYLVFVVEDENNEPVSQALYLEHRDSTIAFSAPDTLILRSGTFVVASPAGAAVAINSRIELPSVDTTFLMTALEYGYVSSTLAKEVARFGGDVDAMVPAPVAEALHRRLAEGARV